MKGNVVSINTSANKGGPKDSVISATLKADYGIINDAHAGVGNRQVSLLDIDRIKQLDDKLKPGDFAENITTSGIDFRCLKLGDKLKINNSVLLEISQIGKDCLSPCKVSKRLGSCIMPKYGVFARVLSGGEIRIADTIEAI